MKLYIVTDGYIDYLRLKHKHVYSNKESERINARKYIGTVLNINSYDYFIPLSSPKENDYYVDEKGNRLIRKDSFLIWRMVSGSGNNAELRGTIRIANMIPVPKSELLLYDIENEQDEKYKDLVQEELEYIRKHEDKLKKRVNVVYNNKTRGNKNKIYEYCLDYNDLEKMHDKWVHLISNAFN